MIRCAVLDLKPLVNIVVDRFKKSTTELPDLSIYVQMDEKTMKNANIIKVTFTMKISMKIVFIVLYDNNSSTVVYGGDI